MSFNFLLSHQTIPILFKVFKMYYVKRLWNEAGGGCACECPGEWSMVILWSLIWGVEMIALIVIANEAEGKEEVVNSGLADGGP